MWIAFDKAKLMDCRTNDDGSVSVDHARREDALERAERLRVQPLLANVHDVDDVTHEVKETWKNCLVAGRDEAAAREQVASMFGEDWAYEFWPDGKGKYPARFLVVEVPDTMTFGCLWICDRVDQPPRAAREA